MLVQFIDSNQDQCNHQQLRTLQQGNRFNLQYSAQAWRLALGTFIRPVLKPAGGRLAERYPRLVALFSRLYRCCTHLWTS